MAWLFRLVSSVSIVIFLNSAAYAEMKFAKKVIAVGSKKITVEIADTPDKQAHGLMYRKSLGADEGMLFVFPESRPQNFWMKNTFVALDLGYFDNHKKLKEIAQMKPMKSEMDMSQPDSHLSQGPAQYVLEMNQGWFKKNKIKIGDSLNMNP